MTDEFGNDVQSHPDHEHVITFLINVTRGEVLLCVDPDGARVAMTPVEAQGIAADLFAAAREAQRHRKVRKVVANGN
jgi:hypothetical protein